MHSPQSPHHKTKSSLACCLWLEWEVPPNTSWARGILEDNVFLNASFSFTPFLSIVCPVCSSLHTSFSFIILSTLLFILQTGLWNEHCTASFLCWPKNKWHVTTCLSNDKIQEIWKWKISHPSSYSSFNTYIIHSCSSSAWKWYVRLSIEMENWWSDTVFLRKQIAKQTMAGREF